MVEGRREEARQPTVADAEDARPLHQDALREDDRRADRRDAEGLEAQAAVIRRARGALHLRCARGEGRGDPARDGPHPLFPVLAKVVRPVGFGLGIDGGFLHGRIKPI